MHPIVQKVEKYIQTNQLIKSGDTICLAVSGGADSVALLNIFLELKDKLSLKLLVCHFDHKQRKESGEDKKFVEDIAENRGVPFIFGSLEAKNKNNLSEEILRNYRYKFFEKILNSDRGVSSIATAHNMNDLAETLLMRLIRGSGTKGLSGILPRRNFFIRPLLSLQRKEIEQYLLDIKVTYKTDQSNLDNQFLRNKIRNLILPDLQKINPKIIQSLAKTADSLTKDYNLINSILECSIPRLIDQQTDQKIVISRKKFIAKSKNLKTHLLLSLFSKISPAKDISSIHLINSIKLIEKGEGCKTLPLPHSLRLTLKNDKIYLLNENINKEK